MSRSSGRLILLLLLVCPPIALAAGPAAQSVYEIHPWWDGPIIGVAALGAALPVVYESKIIHKQCPCDSGDVNSLDRPVIQYHSQAAQSAGDITVAAALVAVPVLDGLDIGFANKTYVEDMVVYAEVLSVNSAVSNAFRYSTQRPRPSAYRNSPAPSKPGEFASFYSGHTSSVFAGLSAASMTYNLRHGPHLWPWIVTGVIGLGEASTRVLGGRHFYTDVATGMVAGTAIGTLIPYLHRRNAHATVSITPVVSDDSFQLVFGRSF
jgi:membrane-associated phospholipid phosphatase